jgi:gluconate 2-dehydrogenase gamma chain
MTQRRDVLKAIALAPLAAITWTRDDVERAAMHVAGLETQTPPKFFSSPEWKLVRVLVDDIIPKDARSGSATDARVPEFMDFILSERNDAGQRAMRTGLAWLDQEAQKRFGKAYADCAQSDRNRILDDIAWPARATDAYRANATWFNSVRDLTAAGFFSSRVGYRDLGYTGGLAQPRWVGAPPEVLRRLGVSYSDWDRKYGRGY